MSDLNTAEYYRGREQTERALADAAANPSIAAIHRQMANSYRDLTAGSGAAEQPIVSLKTAHRRQV